MKKVILIAALALISASAMAQTTTKAQYRYFVQIPIADYQQLINAAHGYRDGSTYNVTLKADQRISLQAGIDAFLLNLPERVKVDSVRIDSGYVNRQKVRAHIDSVAAAAKAKADEAAKAKVKR